MVQMEYIVEKRQAEALESKEAETTQQGKRTAQYENKKSKVYWKRPTTQKKKRRMKGRGGIKIREWRKGIRRGYSWS